MCRACLARGRELGAERAAQGWAPRRSKVSAAARNCSRAGGYRAKRQGPLPVADAEMLAAAGLSNRQIAQHLFITQPTVETHLRHAFQKLGIASRADLPAQLPSEAPVPAGAPAWEAVRAAATAAPARRSPA